MVKAFIWIIFTFILIIGFAVWGIYSDLNVSIIDRQDYTAYKNVIDEYDANNTCSNISVAFTVTEEVAPNQVLIFCNGFDEAYKIDYSDPDNVTVERTSPKPPVIPELIDSDKRYAPSL